MKIMLALGTTRAVALYSLTRYEEALESYDRSLGLDEN